MPMGPLELADTVDIARAAGEELAGGQEPPRCLADRLSRGQLGRKTGQGFYAWRDGKPVRTRRPPPRRPAAGPIQPLIDATRQRVDQGIVADADLADAGVIFGTGFAPSRAVPCIIKAGPRRSAVEEIRLTPIDRAAEPGSSAITTPIQHEEAVP